LSRALAAVVIRLVRRAEPFLARTLVGAERGQSMIEYAFVVALIAIGTVVAVRAFGVGISDVFNGLIERIRGSALS
jgi:Flp pilus assembly pilin Flp